MNVVHFLSNGSAKLIFRYQKERFCMSPILIIRALLDITDRDIYRRLTEPGDSDYYLRWGGVRSGGGELHWAAEEGLMTTQTGAAALCWPVLKVLQLRGFRMSINHSASRS